MGVLSHDGQSRKRKRNVDQSMLEDQTSGCDSPSKNEKKKKRKSLTSDDSVKARDTDKVQPESGKKKKQSKKSVVVGEIDANEENNSPLKGKKRKKSLVEGKGDSVIVDVSPKKKKTKKVKEGKESDTNSEAKKEAKKNMKSKKNSQSKKETEEDDDEIENDSESPENKLSKTDKLINSVLDYLHQWKNNTDTWKISKYYQACLIKYAFDPYIVNEEDYKTCLQYFDKCQGNAVDRLKMRANAVLKGEEDIGKARGNKAKRYKDSTSQKDVECTLFVKNLPYGKTKDEVQDELKKIFPTASAIRTPYKSPKLIGFAYVEFRKPSEVTSALSKRGVKMGGRVLSLDYDSEKKRALQCSRPVTENDEAEIYRRAEEILKMLT